MDKESSLMEDEFSLLEEESEQGTQLTEEEDEYGEEEQGGLGHDRAEERQCSGAALDSKDQSAGEGGGTAGASQQESGGRGFRRRSRSNLTDTPLPLTMEQKLYEAQKEIAEVQQQQEKLKRRYEGIQDNCKASLEEAVIRLAEIEKARSEFEQRRLRLMKKNKLEMREPEKVLQYIVGKLKAPQLEKLKLNNRILNAQEKTLKQQLHQRREMEKAEFEGYQEQTAEINLDDLQINHLKVQRALRSHKKLLHSVMQEAMGLSSDIAKKKQMLAEIEEKIQHAEEERLKAETLNKHWHRQTTDYQAPDIVEYIHVKDTHKKLQQSIPTWERKVRIAEMDLKIHPKAQNKHKTALATASSIKAGAKCLEQGGSVKLPLLAEMENPSGKKQ